MPSIVTHHIFAKDISKKVNFNENDIYLLFAQSHDYLLYNFNKHKTLIEDSMFPESKSYEPVSSNEELGKKGFEAEKDVVSRPLEELGYCKQTN